MDWDKVKKELGGWKDNAYQRNVLLQTYWHEIEIVYSQVGIWTQVSNVTGFSPKALSRMTKKQGSKRIEQSVGKKSLGEEKPKKETSVEKDHTIIVNHKDEQIRSVDHQKENKEILKRLDVLEQQIRSLQEVSSDVRMALNDLPREIHSLPYGEEKQSTYQIQTKLLEDLRDLCKKNRVPIKSAVNLALKELIEKYQDEFDSCEEK